MISKLIFSLAFALTLTGGLNATAADISDDVTDVEEAAADSEAARNEARAIRARVEKERAENARELKTVREARQAAESKKQEASVTLKKSEAELGRLANEASQLNKDIIRLNHETMVSERTLADTRARLEKSRTDAAAMKAARAEKQMKLSEINKQKMQLMREVAIADDDMALETKQLEKIAAEEKLAIEELEKTRAEEVVRKVQAEAKIKELKDQIQTARAQRKALDGDVKRFKGWNRRLDEQAKVGAAELSSMQQQPEAQPAAPVATATGE